LEDIPPARIRFLSVFVVGFFLMAGLPAGYHARYFVEQSLFCPNLSGGCREKCVGIFVSESGLSGSTVQMIWSLCNGNHDSRGNRAVHHAG
jgi:hypothetical protein